MSMAPGAWLASHRHMLPATGDALDVACGRGRNALWLAAQGFHTRAVDRDGEALALLAGEAQRLGLVVTTTQCDLEAIPVETGAGETRPAPFDEAYDVIVVLHYLHRPLFPALLAALRPGGVLVYETFTTAQALRGRPTNPAFLLDPGELRRLTAGLDVLAEREGDFEGRMVAGIVARKPGTGSGKMLVRVLEEQER